MLKKLLEKAPPLLMALSGLFVCQTTWAQNTATNQEELNTSAELEDVDFAEYEAFPIASESDIRKRLTNMRCIVKPNYSPAVHSYIRTYTQNRREKASLILGKIPMYFPMFERKLAKKGMPTDLKYLAIVESALNPEATSSAGAAGLWQFMPSTGASYGLQQGRSIDERRDPNKSTDAAISFLGKLYSQYGNWELALAAYNSGPGRVNSAMKRARSNNFWRIQDHLPRETRNYVPAFIAACYLVNYYSLHGITPTEMAYDLKFTETTKVYERITFQQISDLTGTPLNIIQALNPSYNNFVIPGNYAGDYLVLPFDKMESFTRYYPAPDAPSPNYGGGVIPSPNNSGYVFYVAEAGDNIHSICQKMNCSSEDFKRWNNLLTENVVAGQKFVINNANKAGNRLSAPTANAKPLAATANNKALSPKKVAACAALPVIGLTKLATTPLKTTVIEAVDIAPSPVFTGYKDIIEHQIGRRESLLDIAKKYDTTIDAIIEANKLSDPESLRAGDVLIIGIK
jgi:membrane-bound lytic murein transglycosylase D